MTCVMRLLDQIIGCNYTQMCDVFVGSDDWMLTPTDDLCDVFVGSDDWM